MSEKKDTFTFSEKLKNSKPGTEKKSAAVVGLRRASARVGLDGKPRATLFERTKRDAPFFVAALLALLLLPFLVKYTGTDGDEIPGNIQLGAPETYVSDDMVDGIGGGMGLQPGGSQFENMISLLGTQEAQGADDGYDFDATLPEYTGSDYEGQGLRDTRATAGRTATRQADTTSQIYREIHKTAPRQARARVTRTPTIARNLGGGETRWGGGGFSGSSSPIAAGQSTRGGGVARGPRNPVSLQPVEVARRGRTITGEGALAEATRSLEAMTRQGAMQALMDSQLRPIDPQGGLFGPQGSAGRMGGGSGNNASKWSSKGMLPWWWDLMKQRDQALWQFKFDLITGLIKDLGVPLFKCLLTGDKDGNWDKFLGQPGGGGSPDKCGDFDAAKFKEAYKVDMSEATCKAFGREIKDNKEVGLEWKGATGPSGAVGPLGQRLNCFGANMNLKDRPLQQKVCKFNLIKQHALTYDDRGNGTVGDADFLDGDIIYATAINPKRGAGRFRWKVYHYVSVYPFFFAPDLENINTPDFIDTLNPGTTFNPNYKQAYPVCFEDDNLSDYGGAGVASFGAKGIIKKTTKPEIDSEGKATTKTSISKPEHTFSGKTARTALLGADNGAQLRSSMVPNVRADNPYEMCVIYIKSMTGAAHQFNNNDYRYRTAVLMERLYGEGNAYGNPHLCPPAQDENGKWNMTCVNALRIHSVNALALTRPLSGAGTPNDLYSATQRGDAAIGERKNQKDVDNTKKAATAANKAAGTATSDEQDASARLEKANEELKTAEEAQKTACQNAENKYAEYQTRLSEHYASEENQKLENEIEIAKAVLEQAKALQVAKDKKEDNTAKFKVNLTTLDFNTVASEEEKTKRIQEANQALLSAQTAQAQFDTKGYGDIKTEYENLQKECQEKTAATAIAQQAVNDAQVASDTASQALDTANATAETAAKSKQEAGNYIRETVAKDNPGITDWKLYGEGIPDLPIQALSLYSKYVWEQGWKNDSRRDQGTMSNKARANRSGDTFKEDHCEIKAMPQPKAQPSSAPAQQEPAPTAAAPTAMVCCATCDCDKEPAVLGCVTEPKSQTIDSEGNAVEVTIHDEATYGKRIGTYVDGQTRKYFVDFTKWDAKTDSQSFSTGRAEQHTVEDLLRHFKTTTGLTLSKTTPKMCDKAPACTETTCPQESNFCRATDAANKTVGFYYVDDNNNPIKEANGGTMLPNSDFTKKIIQKQSGKSSEQCPVCPKEPVAAPPTPENKEYVNLCKMQGQEKFKDGFYLYKGEIPSAGDWRAELNDSAKVLELTNKNIDMITQVCPVPIKFTCSDYGVDNPDQIFASMTFNACAECKQFIEENMTPARIAENRDYDFNDLVQAVATMFEKNGNQPIPASTLCKFSKALVQRSKETLYFRRPMYGNSVQTVYGNLLGLWVAHVAPPNISRSWMTDKERTNITPYANNFTRCESDEDCIRNKYLMTAYRGNQPDTINFECLPAKNEQGESEKLLSPIFAHLFNSSREIASYMGAGYKFYDVNGKLKDEIPTKSCDDLKGTINSDQFSRYMKFLCRCGLDKHPIGVGKGGEVPKTEQGTTTTTTSGTSDGCDTTVLVNIDGAQAYVCATGDTFAV